MKGCGTDRMWFDEFFKSSENILDVGCGFGNVIACNPEKIIGMDLVDEKVKICSKRGFTVVKGDAHRLPFKDESFDAVNLRCVIEHLKNPEIAIREFHRILKRGGKIVIKTPDIDYAADEFYAEEYPHTPHVSEFNIRTLKDLVGRYFSIERVENGWRWFRGIEWLYRNLNVGIKIRTKKQIILVGRK